MEHEENNLAVQYYIYNIGYKSHSHQNVSMNTESTLNIQDDEKICKDEGWIVVENKDVIIDNNSNPSKELQKSMNDTMTCPVFVPEVKMNNIDLSSLCCKTNEQCTKDSESLSMNQNTKNADTCQKKQYKCTIF